MAQMIYSITYIYYSVLDKASKDEEEMFEWKRESS